MNGFLSLRAWFPATGISDARARAAFEQEILRSEYQRATVLSTVAAGGIAAVLLHVVLLNSRVADSAVVVFVLATTAVLLACELAARRVLRRRLERHASVPSKLRYVNAAAEVSAVTVTLVYAGHATGSLAYALSLPATAVYFVFIILSTMRLDARVSFFTGATAAFQYAIVAAHAASQTSIVPFEFDQSVLYAGQTALFLTGGLLAGLVARQVRRRVERTVVAVQERDRILKMFGQHTSPAVVEEILNRDPAVAGERKEVAVMFLDIRSFAAFSQDREPEAVVTYLNTLFGPMIDIVHGHDGHVHQLLGDGFMAVFGAPVVGERYVEQAVEAARTIVRYVNAESEAGRIPPTRIGIGLHAGEAVVGFVGSSIHKEYKVTGDVVNLAARLEQLNKEYDSQLLVSENVWRVVETHAHAADDLGEIAIRGYERPLHVYRLA